MLYETDKNVETKHTLLNRKHHSLACGNYGTNVPSSYAFTMCQKCCPDTMKEEPQYDDKNRNSR